jgi:two-component system sensor histidine kinase/response regulator
VTGGADLSLLLVDDSDANLVALEAAVGPMGHPLVRARSGEEALRCLLRYDDFAAVLLDVQMPGLDGYATAEAIRARERTKDLPIIFITAIGRDEAHRLRGFAAGAVDYLFKPVDPELLRAKVSVFVQLYTANREVLRQREDLRRQAAELARSNADLDQFASIVSHDLVEPLNVVTGYLELLSDRLGGGDEKTREWISRMDSCARRMHGLVEDLLAYSRAVADGDGRHRGHVTPLGDALADSLANVHALLSETGSEVSTSGHLPAVAAGRREMTQVLQNLITNAVVHAGRPVRVQVAAEEGPGGVTVRVSDDGPGMDPADTERVFGVFERSELGPAPTTGLGLPICRKIVGRLGGRIWMEPPPDGGLAVLFTVPGGGPA